MSRASIGALLLLALAACRGTPPERELSRANPAHPLAPVPEYQPGPGPFERTVTFAIPGRAGGAEDRSHDHQQTGDAPVKYSCPMHPEIVRDEPGACPECGMALRPMPAPAHGEHQHEGGGR